MKERAILLLTLVALAGMTYAQVSISALSTPVTIDFTGWAKNCLYNTIIRSLEPPILSILF